MNPRLAPLRTALVVLLPVLAIAVPRVASAQCATDDDCEHGFSCEPIANGSGGSSSGSGGASSGGAGGSAGTGADAAGTGSGASAGTSGMGAPFVGPLCGNGMCEGTEATTCPADCSEVLSCVLAECETDDDCATGYECAAEPIAGTGGANGPVCGDGLCTSGETVENCATDCTATRRCSTVYQVCGSDVDCAPGFYCSLPVSGSGGTSSSGSTGAGGFSGGSAGTASGGTANPTGGSSGSSSGGAGGGNGDALVAGVCTPEGEGGVGGGGGAGGVGTGGVPATGGAATGGTISSGGTLATTGGVGGGGGSSGSSGSSGTGSGGDGASSSGGSSGSGTGSGATGGGGSQGGTSNGAGGTTPAGETNDPGSGERGGCSVSSTGTRTSFAEFGVLALILARLVRRRRAPSSV